MNQALYEESTPSNARTDELGLGVTDSTPADRSTGAAHPVRANQSVATDSVLLAYASQTGFIDDVAEITRCDLEAAGIRVRLAELGDVDPQTLARETSILFMTSTTGDGDAPFAAEPFSDEVMAASADLSHLRFGLLCAGDLSYDNFCGFGHRLRDWLTTSGANALFETIDVDCEDDETVERWRCCVRQVLPTVAMHSA